MSNIESIRKEFPFLKQNFIYFDSAATSLKLSTVIDSQAEYYRNLSINMNRGSSSFNYKVTSKIEEIRKATANYIGSINPKEIIYTSNTTDSINIIARSYINKFHDTKKNIVITQLEHHSNYVPWLNASKRCNLECRIVPLVNGKLETSKILDYIDDNTILTSVTGMSNLTGQRTEIPPISKKCRAVGSRLLVDAAQLAAHSEIDVNELDIDYLCFSAHKIYGPFGLGVLYVKESNIKDLEPVSFGGNMVSYISKDNKVHYKDFPYCMESGTQNSAAIFAFGKVLEYLKTNPVKEMEKYKTKLGLYLTDELKKLNNIIIYSVPGPIVSFNIEGVHPHDASDFFDKAGILLRTGNLCASPFFHNIEESGVIRVSLDIFNTKEEIDVLLNTVKSIKEFFLESV